MNVQYAEQLRKLEERKMQLLVIQMDSRSQADPDDSPKERHILT